MAVTSHRVFRSDHYKQVKEAVDTATELNAINVSKRYYTGKSNNSFDSGENKTFPHYLLEELIDRLGANYFYRTAVVEVFNPIKSKLNQAIIDDQNILNGQNIRDFNHLFEINASFIAELYPNRFFSFSSGSNLLKYLKTFPTINYLFEYEHIKEDFAIIFLEQMIKDSIIESKPEH
ncbi:TPA: hypothetical protein ACMDXT_000207 [Vibrio parahaemolyticus]|uniref:hypothetical protein n=1 Tax=Vibrio alginolyticus TaxID=663 RepID=UPI003ABABE95